MTIPGPRKTLNKIWLIAMMILAAAAAAAQQPAATASAPAFEAASVKPGDPGSHMMSMGAQPGQRFTANNVTLKMLIGYAYNLHDSQLLGITGWMDSDTFNIDAKGPDGPPLSRSENTAQARLMLQALLADRFKLSVKHETREMSVFNLTVAKGGPRLKPDAAPMQSAADSSGPSAPPPPPPPPPGAGRDAATPARINGGPMRPGQMMMAPGRIVAMAAPISNFAAILSNDLGETVIDKTGLAGTYDFDLQWSPAEGEQFGGMRGGRAMADGANAPPPPDDAGQSIFSALETQMGLKLESGKGPVEVLEVEHAEKPSGN